MKVPGFRIEKTAKEGMVRPGQWHGEMTAFLTLVFILIVSFIGSLMESASLQMAKNYRRADVERAVESIFAEYQKELLQEFDIFGLDGSYENTDFSEELVMNRLDFYGADGISIQIQALQLLTDDGGYAFREQAARYMENKYGIDFAAGLTGDISLWEEQSQGITELEAFAREQELNLESLMMGSEQELPAENNPLAAIQTLKNKPLLELVFPDEKQISQGVIQAQEMPSSRACKKGYGIFPENMEKKDAGTLVFGEYVLEHFCHAADEEQKSVASLQYEIEYIIAGEGSDKENIDEVIKKLLLLRMVSNYGYVLSDTKKHTEAQTMAVVFSTAILLPEISGAITQALLLAWAFGESVMDMRSLLEGEKVPLVKTSDSWQLSLESLSKLGTAEDAMKGNQNSTGLSYKEYLRILLFLEEKTKGTAAITMRTIDMTEKRLRFDKGLDWFRADHCISKLNIKSTCNLRRGITYQFETWFGYQ